MSSIMEKGKLPTKMFLRSNSFQKLCSLAHPMRLRGFKSNKEALKSVFESLIVTTRGVIQSVTYRILCFLFLTPFTKLLSRPLQGIVDAATSAGRNGGTPNATNRLNTVRLILKLTLSMIISTDKAVDNELKLSEDDFNGDLPRTVVDTAVQTEVPAADLDQDPEPATEKEQQQQFFDCKEPTDSVTSSPRLQFLESSALRLQLERVPPPSYLTRGAVYGCVLCCLVQLSVLVHLLSGDAVRFPPGLIFLILALAYIGYVMKRIFSFSPSTDCRKMPKTTPATKKEAEPSKAVMAVPEGAIRKHQQQQQPPKGLHPILAAVSKRILATILQQQQKDIGQKSASPRMSRSATRTRMLLCADDKTISKMKIL